MTTAPVWVSVVIPVKDERDNLAPLTERLMKALDSRVESRSAAFEILFVDDGSTDGSGPVLDQLAAIYPPVTAIHLDANHGQTAAFDAGFRHSRGTLVVTIDGDLTVDAGFTCTDCVTLTTETAGNYVASVSEGTALDCTGTGEGAAVSCGLDTTELTNVTWSAGGSATATIAANLSGANDPSLVLGNRSLGVAATGAPYLTIDDADIGNGAIPDFAIEVDCAAGPACSAIFVQSQDSLLSKTFLTAANTGAVTLGSNDAPTVTIDTDEVDSLVTEGEVTVLMKDYTRLIGRLGVSEGRVTVTGDPDHAVSRGALCAKCSLAYNGVWRDPSKRLARPL